MALIPKDLEVLALGLSYVTALLIVAIVAGFRIARAVPSREKLIAVWFIWDALIHFTLEGAYLFLEFSGTTKTSPSFFAQIWREYGRADARWNMQDTCLLSMELITVFGTGPMAIAMVYGIANKKPWRHFLQVIISTCELYGGWMTFAPEWISGNKFLNTSDPFLFWCHLVFFNMIWVVIPLLLIWHAYSRLAMGIELLQSVYMPGFDADDDAAAAKFSGFSKAKLN